MAFAYFMGHWPKGFYPYANGGNLAIMYCFVFFYLAFAGGGPWSLDAILRRNREPLIDANAPR
jgi:putative oxidoreductase